LRPAGKQVGNDGFDNARGADQPKRMPLHGRSATIAAIGIFIPWAQTATAQDCPTAKSAAAGFVVERGESSKTEVLHIDDGNVRTILRYNGRAVLETTQFHGLFDLERLDQGRRSVFRPTSDLPKALPPKVGQKISVTFEVTESGRQSTRTVMLSVKKADTLHIGRCQYSVLQIDRNAGRDGGKPVFINTDYYAPILKLIIAKEFQERDGRTSLNKFDRIYPIQQ
jgi:hypothetical protein